MFTINGLALPPPRIVRNTVPATRIPVHQGDGFQEVHARYAALRAREFGVDAATFGIHLEIAPDPLNGGKPRYELLHHFADGGPEHVVHARLVGAEVWTPGRKAAIDSNLRSAFDNRMWRLRHAQSRLDALAAAGMHGDHRPSWSVVADEIVQGVLDECPIDVSDIVTAFGTTPFATREMPVKRRRSADPARDRHALLENRDIRDALAPMRGSIEGGTLHIERMELGRGAFYDGHPSGALISVPLDHDLPETLMIGLPGNPIGGVVGHPLIPGHLEIASVRRTSHMLQIAVRAPKVPLRLTPVGIGYDVTLR